MEDRGARRLAMEARDPQECMELSATVRVSLQCVWQRFNVTEFVFDRPRDRPWH